MSHLASVLAGPQPELQQHIIGCLEEVLEAARDGRYAGGILLLELSAEEGSEWIVLGTRSRVTLVGRLELAKHLVLAQEG